MANTISELYEKYAEQVEGALEEDRYFQYLFEMVQAGRIRSTRRTGYCTRSSMRRG